MTTATEPDTAQRAPLTRDRIVDAAVRYVDNHGLSGLSMHKLGGELGVKGMSLYNHVANKRDLLDGVVERLWAEVDEAAPAAGQWRDGYRAFAQALRDTVRRHPGAAPLIMTHGTMPAPALRCIQKHIATATGRGVPEECAYATLRSIAFYALGTALNELVWNGGDDACRPDTIADVVRPDVPADLVAVAEIFCGQADPEAQFVLGLDAMLRGIDVPDRGR